MNQIFAKNMGNSFVLDDWSQHCNMY